MKKRVFLTIFIFLLSIFCIDIGLSNWIYIGSNKTENSLVINDSSKKTHTITTHGMVDSLNITSSKHYYVPNTFTVSNSITPYNKNGTAEIHTITWTEKGIFGSSTTKEVKFPIFYEVINGTYRRIEQWSNGAYADTQIKSFDCDVSSWTEVSEAQYGDVWNCTVKDSTGANKRLFFQEISGRMKDYQTTINQTIYEDIFKEEEPYFDENGNYVTSNIYLRIIVSEHYKYQNGWSGIKSYSYNHYPMFQLRKETTIIKRDPSSEYLISKKYKVRDGDTINPTTLNIANYKEYGYYSDSSYKTPFDFSTPITSDCDIYIRLLDTKNNQIFNEINSGTNSNVNIYNSLNGSNAINSSTDYNVVGNPAFNVYDKIFYLGESTLNASRTLSLTYGNVETYIDPCEGTINQTASHRKASNNSIAYDYEGSTYIGLDNCSLYVSLAGNLTIKGNLVIGGEVGGTGGTYYSYIIGKYTILDLHGYDLIVDGGTVKNFGVIKDTLGTGKIIVKNGGKITTTLTVSDGRGKNPSIMGFAKRQAPFTEYHVMYIQTPVCFYMGTTFEFYLKIDLDDIGITNLYFNFITNESSSNEKSLFCWSDSTNDNEQFLLFSPNIEQEIYKNATFYKHGYYFRNQFLFHANAKSMKNLKANLSVTISGITKSAAVDLLRVDFPISPFFDIVVDDGYSLTLNTKFIFYPSSSLYVKKGGTIKLGYYGAVTYKSESANILSYSITIPGESRFLCGGIVNFTNCLKDISKHRYSLNGIYNQITSYFSLMKPANISIDGNLEINTSLTVDSNYNDSYYILAGEIDMHNDCLNYIKSNKSLFKTYDLKGELIDGFVYGSRGDGSTYASVDSQFEICSCYNIQPLIVNGKGYIFDSSHEIIGGFNKKTNLVTVSENEKYALITNDYMYEGGNSSSHQENRIDRTVNISRVNTCYDQYNIISLEDDNYYLLFSGMYTKILDSNISFNFVNNDIIRINTSKFISNTNAPLFVNMTKILTSDGSKTKSIVNLAPLYSDLTVYYNSSTKIWIYRYFTSYPTVDTGIGYKYSY